MIRRLIINRNFRTLLISFVLLLNLFGFLYYYYFYVKNGYLPAPFFHDKSDTFMDFFNVMYEAYDNKRYIDWGSVYPPLNFLILQAINYNFHSVPEVSGHFFRKNSLYLINIIFVIYLLFPILIIRLQYWSDILFVDKFLLYFLIILSTPMLFALERGNLILLCPFFLALMFSNRPLIKNISLAILINIKPYFIVLMFLYVCRSDWKNLIKSILFSGLLFLITGVLLDNNFLLFFNNLFKFSSNSSLFSITGVLSLPTSISSYAYVFNSPSFISILSDNILKDIFSFLKYTINSVMFFSVMALLTIVYFKKRKINDDEIIAALVIMLANIGLYVGSYSVIFYMTLIPVFMRSNNRYIYLCILILHAIPLDLITVARGVSHTQSSFLSGKEVQVAFTLGLGALIRPIANFLLLIFFTYDIYSLRRYNLTKALHLHIAD